MKGLLGKRALPANSNETLYHANDKIAYADININVLNPTASDATISIVITQNPTAPTLDTADFIEQDFVLTGNGSVLIRSGEILSPSEAIVVRSNVAGVVVRVSGKEHVN